MSDSKTLPKLEEFPKYTKLPLNTHSLETFDKPVLKEVNQSGTVKRTDDDGTEIVVMAKKVQVDSKQFIKMYKMDLKFFYDLGSSAFKLWYYIGNTKLKQNDCIVFLSQKELKEKTGMAKNTYFKAIRELLAAEFIYRSENHYKYFININRMFNGSEDGRKRVVHINAYETNGDPFNKPKSIEPNIEFLNPNK